MKKLLAILLMTMLVITSCSKNNDNDNTDKHTLAYFTANLKADLTYTDIVRLLGVPEGDLGSGIHIYYYTLNDGTLIYIGYTDKILYARHASSFDTVLHVII